MSRPLPLAIYLVAAVTVGMAMDWAIFERVKMVFGAFGDVDEVKYRDLPFWRMVMVGLASAIVGVALASQATLGVPFWAGTVLFAASNIYGDSIALRR